jgi:TetR/AcrR family transcriptional regulator, transcriptional repressor for nem operon
MTTKKGDATKLRIIEETAPLFNTKGYNATSIQDVLDTTGIKKGGLYNHFKNKDDLALAAFDHALGLLQAAHSAAQAQAQAHNSISRLEAIIAVTHHISQDQVIMGGCPLLNVSVEADSSHPALKERAQYATRVFRSSLKNIIVQGQESGEIPSTIQAESSASVILMLIEGSILMSRLYNNQNYIDEVKDHIIRFLQLEG